MTRRLTEEEHALWERLRETVKPLKRPRKAPAKTASSPKPLPKRNSSMMPNTEISTAAAKSAKAQPSLAPLEQRTRRRLARGSVEVDARIDLHGMRQERAHAALAAFLRSQQALGARIVLVVTGKGRPESEGAGEGRGVLRQSVPRWLAGNEFRDVVVGFEEAHRRYGGSGALYVRIRRRRVGGRSPAAAK